jgi:hypothetical protein
MYGGILNSDCLKRHPPPSNICLPISAEDEKMLKFLNPQAKKYTSTRFEVENDLHKKLDF